MTDRLLVLGARGMLGSTLLRVLPDSGLPCAGTLRGDHPSGHADLHTDVDARDLSSIEAVLERVKPTVVVNCIGVIKQLAEAKDPVVSIEINALFPHRLARLCLDLGIRLIHVSTDCVFSGNKGHYAEADNPDPVDLYGRSKLLGELDEPGALTLRTSIIGHEVATKHGLVDWFLSQSAGVRGFRRAIYSGLPTCEVARVLVDHVLPNPRLEGLYQLSSAPISKYELLKLVAAQYGKQIEITPDDAISCDRSLDSSRFTAATGYVAPAWPELVTRMHRDHLGATNRTTP